MDDALGISQSVSALSSFWIFHTSGQHLPFGLRKVATVAHFTTLDKL